ncbi:hypothetical protein [Actinoplanes subtropicus]|uniref:hypothetical protein n=1 Tax=Actinoplanes subtropicus TaxID=543632 RepID=UPI000559329B|nr:hypothetical protein [Actinoplanes subtropicus]
MAAGALDAAAGAPGAVAGALDAAAALAAVDEPPAVAAAPVVGVAIALVPGVGVALAMGGAVAFPAGAAGAVAGVGLAAPEAREAAALGADSAVRPVELPEAGAVVGLDVAARTRGAPPAGLGPDVVPGGCALRESMASVGTPAA